uniref:Uncharacterized protein LOC105647182 isoform X1 n=1 Tax=Rhizophora mucronata TaxID=61149 RepID=A0A2P2MFA2_RHIMU
MQPINIILIFTHHNTHKLSHDLLPKTHTIKCPWKYTQSYLDQSSQVPLYSGGKGIQWESIPQHLAKYRLYIKIAAAKKGKTDRTLYALLAIEYEQPNFAKTRTPASFTVDKVSDDVNILNIISKTTTEKSSASSLKQPAANKDAFTSNILEETMLESIRYRI